MNGTITPYFGEKIDMKKFKIEESFDIYIYLANSHGSMYDAGNTTFRIKYDVEDEFECLRINRNETLQIILCIPK